MSNIVIVESPAKAKTIEKYLGPDYKVMASIGHIRDLLPKNGSVNTDEQYKMTWEISPQGRKVVHIRSHQHGERLYNDGGGNNQKQGLRLDKREWNLQKLVRW